MIVTRLGFGHRGLSFVVVELLLCRAHWLHCIQRTRGRVHLLIRTPTALVLPGASSVRLRELSDVPEPPRVLGNGPCDRGPNRTEGQELVASGSPQETDLPGRQIMSS